MAASPRVFDFDVSIDDEGTTRSALGETSIRREDTWWAEHLVLAGLLRCTLASLKHAARRAGLEVSANGTAHGTVTRRDEDGLYAFVDIESRLDVELVPAPDRLTVAELLAKTERGCFVGNSLTAKPRYRWTVNGEAIE
jgi:organic hydroperoxide reductase OsmC/OhrA